MHDCFIRELKDGARPVDRDPDVLTSPCDAIVGACGTIAGTELLPDQGLSLHAARSARRCRTSSSALSRRPYVTLRLTSSMYHRFHAPHDCRVEQVTYISGDTWNVNPIALKRVEKLFCKNERAVIATRLAPGGPVVTLVPVAAILVASIRLHFLDVLLDLRVPRAERHPCDRRLRKGRGDGLVRARLDHRDAGAGCLVIRRGHRDRHGYPYGPAALPARRRCQLVARIATWA